MAAQQQAQPAKSGDYFYPATPAPQSSGNDDYFYPANGSADAQSTPAIPVAAGLPAGTRPAGLPAGMNLPGLPSSPASLVNMGVAPPSAQRASTALSVARPVRDVVKGAGEGGLSTLLNLNNLVQNHTGAFGRWAGLTPEQEQELRSAATSDNTAQAIGKGAEQVGEFFVPGGAEEELAAKAAPYVGKALPALKMGLAAIGAGAVNKAQGGSFVGGAAGGAAGSVIGQGIQKIAPVLAETALGVRAPDRAYDRTPGQFIIDETSGSDPGKVAQRANDIVAGDTAQLDKNALNSTIPVNLEPARSTANSFLQTAQLQNNPDLIRDVNQVGTQLAMRGGTAIPPQVPAHEGLALKRGLNALTNYSPNMTNGLGDAAVKGTVASLHPELAAAIPGYDALNSRISTAIPVAKRAGAADLNASVLQRVVGRLARPTGALAGAGFGGYEGAKHGGTEGALLGAGIGLVAPEILASPRTILREARFANAAGPAVGKIANASAQQFFRRNR